jgi:hypothetical protein
LASSTKGHRVNSEKTSLLIYVWENNTCAITKRNVGRSLGIQFPPKCCLRGGPSLAAERSKVRH